MRHDMSLHDKKGICTTKSDKVHMDKSVPATFTFAAGTF